MPLSPYCCDHCGFWQRHSQVPATCPVCEDFRHPRPPDSYRFRTPAEVGEAIETCWIEVQPGLWFFYNEPTIGIGPGGYLLVRPEGNVAFEGASWYSDDALAFMASLGGVQTLSASHPHVYGGLWRLADRFRPEVILHRNAFPFAQALADDPSVYAWPFNSQATLSPTLSLHHTGGHTPGHAVLYDRATRTLFCGDALKFELDGDGPVGHARTISCHLAFDAHLPLSHDEIRRYAAVLAPLDFDQVCTPWEIVRPGAGRGLSNHAAMLRLFEAQLEGRPFADRFDLAPYFLPGAETLAPAIFPEGLIPNDPLPVQRYRQALPAEHPVYEFPIDALDGLGVPVWTAAQWQDDGELCNSVGYGGTAERARTGAYGELMERVAAHRGTAHLPRRQASYDDLRAAGEPVLDPLRLRLPVGTDYAPSRRLRWIQARQYPSGETVWVPAEAAASNFADLGAGGEGEGDWLFTPITNGLGAGDTLERALTHGLLELVQRDGNSAAYRALDRHIGIDIDSLTDPAARRLLHRYDAAGLDVRVKLAETPLGIVSLYVVGAERDLEAVPQPIMLTGCGEGADPDREVALRKALLEFAASRARKLFNHGPLGDLAHLFPPGYLERVRQQPAQLEEARSFRRMKAWMDLDAQSIKARLDEDILRVDHTVRFSSLPTVAPGSLGDVADKLRTVAGRYADEGLDIYYVDLLPDDSPARAVKVIAPGMEVETMTYDRIGPRNVRRLLERDLGLVGFGDPPPGAQRVPLTAENEADLGGPVWFSTERAQALVDGLYAMYREPSRHVIALASERAQTAGDGASVAAHVEP